MKLTLLFLLTAFTAGCAHDKPSSGYKGFGKSSLSKPQLAKFAPKPLQTSQLTRVQKMLDIRATSSGIITSDGKTLFTNWSVSGTNQVWKVPGPNQFPIQMSGGSDRAHLYKLTPNGKYLILSRDKDGDEMPGIYLQSAKGGPFIEIFKKKNTQSFFQFVTPDSKYIYFRANDKNKSSYAIYKYNLNTNKTIEVFNGQPAGYWKVSDYRKDGTILLAKINSNIASEYFLYNEKEKKLRPILGQNEVEQYSVQFGRTKNELLVLTNKFGEFRRLYTYNISQKIFSPITENLKYNIENVQVDPSKKRITYLINENGYFKMKAIQFDNFKPLRTPHINSKTLLQTYYGSTSFNGRYTTIKAIFNDSPGETYVYDWNKNTLKQWTRSSIPEVNLTSLVVPKLEYYEARDGSAIPMLVQRPKSCVNKSCPVIVDFHGGPESQASPSFKATISLYLEQGFVYVRPNVRGSDGFGKAWLNSDNGAKRLEVLSDIEDASLYIKKNWAYGGDVPKVAAMGGSYGGYSVFAAMTIFAGSFDAGVAVVGMSDLVSFLQNTADYRRRLRESEYGYLAHDMDILKKLSPINYLDKLKNPLLIIHGANDPRVPVGEALQIYNKMKEKNLPAELIIFDDEGHGIRKRKNKVIYLGHILKFMKSHLK